MSRIVSPLISKLKRQTKRKIKTPFVDRQNDWLIIHCCHHKVGTVWFKNILRAIADEFELIFQYGKQNELRLNTDIFMEDHSYVDILTLPPYRGSHLIRDPRDVIISAYFYHLWTEEEWTHIPRKEFGGMSYQKYLNGLDQEEGILTEMKTISGTTIKDMLDWDYTNSSFIEIKYEKLINDELSTFYKIFKHYGFSEQAINTSLKIAEKFSFRNMTNREIGEIKIKSHMRSGRPGEWMDFFSDKHKKYFKNLFGDALIKLGYEANNDW